jgi:adenylate cyclase class 2
MFEVEAKVPITRRAFESLKKRLHKEARFLGKETYKDTYYSTPKKAYIRIRQRGGEYFLDIKRKKTAGGIESNLEMQWKVIDIKEFRSLLKKLSIKAGIRKQKKSQRFKQNDFIIELNHVRLLGYYLEIERIVEKEEMVPRTKKELIKLFKNLGFEPKDFEPKPYLELLTNV